MIRLYFNERGPVPWSTDEGDPSTERKWAGVNVDAYGYTMTDFSKVPSAWIYFGDWAQIVENGVSCTIEDRPTQSAKGTVDNELGISNDMRALG